MDTVRTTLEDDIVEGKRYRQVGGDFAQLTGGRDERFFFARDNGTGNEWAYFYTGLYQSREDEPSYRRHLVFPFVEVDADGKDIIKKPLEPEVDLWNL